jgi:uncharacterized membrane protein YdjX (TVP38/TMEM64 family)
MSERNRLLLGLAVAVAIAVASCWLPLSDSTVRLALWIQGLGATGVIVYLLAFLVGALLWVPGSVLMISGGLLYGPLWGPILVSPAGLFSATISFLLARYLFRGWVSHRLQAYPRFSLADRAFQRTGFKMVVLMRLEPLFLPFAAQNYLLGISRIRLRDYMLASWVGLLPASIAYSYIGSALHSVADVLHGGLGYGQGWNSRVFWACLVVTLLLLVLLARVAHQALRQEMDASQKAATPIDRPQA